MLSALNDWQIQAVQAFIKDFIMDPAEDSHFRPLTEKELCERIDIGLAQAGRGEEMEAEEFADEPRQAVGFT